MMEKKWPNRQERRAIRRLAVMHRGAELTRAFKNAAGLLTPTNGDEPAQRIDLNTLKTVELLALVEAIKAMTRLGVDAIGTVIARRGAQRKGRRRAKRYATRQERLEQRQGWAAVRTMSQQLIKDDIPRDQRIPLLEECKAAVGKAKGANERLEAEQSADSE